MAMSEVRIIYEDDNIMVVDKPAGMLVIPAPGDNGRTLTYLLNHDPSLRAGSAQGAPPVSPAVQPCHRIDRQTSGLIIYAKGKKTQQAMMEEFKQRRVKKSYTAFVNGRLDGRRTEISSSIEGKKALTRYRLLEQRRDFAVIEVEPVTGRTNQIRIHFKSIGHPLVGERKFAFARDYKLRFRRAALHSRRIEFNHPATGQRMSFESPMPDDMEKFLENNK